MDYTMIVTDNFLRSHPKGFGPLLLSSFAYILTFTVCCMLILFFRNAAEFRSPWASAGQPPRHYEIVKGNRQLIIEKLVNLGFPRPSRKGQ